MAVTVNVSMKAGGAAQHHNQPGIAKHQKLRISGGSAA